MDRNLEDCLNDNVPGKYIFPFFWQHGETHKILLDGINAIFQCGIREFCIESRIHEQFCEAKWWADMEFILKEAKKRDMRVWMLDDKRFPTGYANGWITKHMNLRKKAIRLEFVDIAGADKDCAILANRLKEDEEYVAITAWKRKPSGECFYPQWIDLMPFYSCDLVYIDIPEGIWRVFFVIRTYDTVPERWDYIDLLSEESCRAMIHAVYEPHYIRFKKYFGNVFAGFFFDEPGFGNDELTYQSKLGKPNMLIPWNDELLQLMGNDLKTDESTIRCMLPALWQNMETKTPWIRMVYMDLVSKMVKYNFSNMLGEWCNKHGVMSVGHLIEDMNAHMRLGYGTGHYFRGLEGQDMAGMDIVLGQINPKIYSMEYTAPVIEDYVSPAFFSYTLPRMAVSHAHFCKKKKGRAMCEIFGAYGWSEGLPMMKQIVDRLLACGINYFVPHAFSAKYPDEDCPPHFWAGGKQSQFHLVGELVSYMKKCCHLLSDGFHRASVALLYLPEAEWAGGNYMPLEKLAVKLSKNQIEFDIIPEDELYSAIYQEGRIQLVQGYYRVFLVPYSRYLPKKLLDKISELINEGADIYFIDGVPDFYELPTDRNILLPYESMVKKLYMLGVKKLFAGEEYDRDLRVYDYCRGDICLLVFLNEDMTQDFSGVVQIPENNGFFYDVWENRIYPKEIKDSLLNLHLFPGELKIFVYGKLESCICERKEILGRCRENKKDCQIKSELDLRYQISLWENQKFSLYRMNSKLVNLSRPEYLPQYSGAIRYEASFEVKDPLKFQWMDLGKVGETAEVWINDVFCGARISIPYCFYVKDALKRGTNRIRIEITNNMAYREKDILSKYFQLPPSGLLGPVTLIGD